jgi:hypothetical protein
MNVFRVRKKTTYLQEITHKGNGSLYDRLLIASDKEIWDRVNALSVYSVTTCNSNALEL